MATESTLLWFRRDLRLTDNPALAAAVAEQRPLIPLFIWDENEGDAWRTGGASRVWLGESLEVLRASLRALGSELIIHSGQACETLLAVAQACNVSRIHCNARYEPWAQAQQADLRERLAREGITLIVHTDSYLLYEPESVRTGSGGPYQVYTPFFKRCMETPPELNVTPAPAKIIPPPDSIIAPNSLPGGDNPPKTRPESSSDSSCIGQTFGLFPAIPWDREMRAYWQPGEVGAMQLLRDFLAQKANHYDEGRDRPGQDGTSRLAPSLHFGEITPRQIWAAVSELPKTNGTATYLKEIIWREFAYHVLHHFPHLPETCLKPTFQAMPWASNPGHFNAWTQGQTGYPIVDAGMRQLWRIGWMHNRVRMIVGSFLTKHLMLPWQDGERWFWDTLVDADLGANSFNWQWIAGCGADAAPFFRIFNPVLQGEKFDPRGDYIRQWVPELARLPDKWIHQPWNAPPFTLLDAGIRLGETYPAPIVDHGEARERAMLAYKKLSATRQAESTP